VSIFQRKVTRKIKDLPAVTRDGDGAAAQPNGHVEASQVEAVEGGDRGGGAAGRRDDTIVALFRGGWGHWEDCNGGDRGCKGCGGGDCASKGLWHDLVGNIVLAARTMSTEAMTTTDSSENMSVWLEAP
jgi:hypothetical protein